MMVKKKRASSVGVKNLWMNKKAKGAFLGVFVFATALSVLFLASYVFAAFSGAASNVPAPGDYFVIPDDVTTQINISINNTDTAYHNISNVTIVLDGVTFDLAENGSDTVAFAVANFSTTRIEYSAFNLSNQSQAYIWFNITGATPGRNASGFNVTLRLANESHAVAAESNITVHVNDTFTAAANGSGSDGDRANVTFLAPFNYTMKGNETQVYLNVSIWNRTQMLQANTTLAGVGGDFVINWTGENISADGIPPDTVYSFNITQANGSLGDDANIISIGRIVIKDSTKPVVGLVQNNGSSTTNKIIIDITNTETLTGINGACTVDNSDASITGTNTSQTLTDETGLSCGSSRVYVVTCTDHAGNAGSATYTGFTSSCSGGGGATGGSGSSSGTTYTNTYVDDAEELSDLGSVGRLLGEGERIQIDVGGVVHFVGIIDGGLTDSSATVEVTSEHPQQATLNIGDTENFELDGDTFYDISVTLNSIAGDKADIVIEPTHEEVVVEGEEGSGGIGGAIGDVAGAVGGSAVIWIVIIVIIVIIVLIVYFAKKRDQ